MKTLRTSFIFRTKGQAKKFREELRKSFILTESQGAFLVHIFEFHKIKDDKKEEVAKIANKIYNEIIYR